MIPTTDMAPEVVRHERYSMKCDVFSFAMVTFELFEGLIASKDPQRFAQMAAKAPHVRPECEMLQALGTRRARATEGLIKACWCAVIASAAAAAGAAAAAAQGFSSLTYGP